MDNLPLDEFVDINRGVRVVRSQLTVDGKYPVYQNSLIPLGYYNNSNRPANSTFLISAGAAGDIGFSTVEFWAADDCLFFVPKNGVKLIDRYLYHALLQKQNSIYSKVRRSSVPRLSRNDVASTKIPLPPLPIQAEIVRILDTVLEKENAAKFAAEQILEQIDLLKKSILARAFRGEL